MSVEHLAELFARRTTPSSSRGRASARSPDGQAELVIRDRAGAVLAAAADRLER